MLRAHRGKLAKAAEEADLNPPTAAHIEALGQVLEDEIERGRVSVMLRPHFQGMESPSIPGRFVLQAGEAICRITTRPSTCRPVDRD